MVSLNGNSQHTGGGMMFFSDSLSSYHDDDPLLDAGMPALPHEEAVNRWMTHEIKKFRTIGTVKAILLDMFFYASLALSAFLLPTFCQNGQCAGQEATFLVLYVHGAVWFLLAMVHLYLAREHRASLLHGYFAFHLATRTLRRLPLYINSGATAVLLVVSKILDAVCYQDGSCRTLTKAAYLQMVISLEVLVGLIALFVYLLKTVHFNNSKDVPDFLRVSMSESTPRIQRQIGFRKEQTYKERKDLAMTLMWYEVLYWKHMRADLCRQVLEVHDQLAETQPQ